MRPKEAEPPANFRIRTSDVLSIVGNLVRRVMKKSLFITRQLQLALHLRILRGK